MEVGQVRWGVGVLSRVVHISGQEDQGSLVRAREVEGVEGCCLGLDQVCQIDQMCASEVLGPGVEGMVVVVVGRIGNMDL